MNYIDKIKNTEKEAREIVDAAEKTAQQEVERARSQAAETRDSLVAKLSDDMTSAIEEQKNELAARYRKILKTGETKADEVRQTASRHKKEAVRFVLDNIS